MQSLQKWYTNDAQTNFSNVDSDDFERKKWKKRWNLRTVTSHLKKEEINGAIVMDRSNPMYIGQYSSSLKSVINGLTDNERREYVKLADQWNREEPPRDIQKR